MVDYTRFSAQAMRAARAIGEIQDHQSATYKKARSANAAQLEAFINKTLNDCKTIHRRMEGLDAFFQSKEVPQEVRGTMKGSGLNLKTSLK